MTIHDWLEWSRDTGCDVTCISKKQKMADNFLIYDLESKYLEH